MYCTFHQQTQCVHTHTHTHTHKVPIKKPTPRYSLKVQTHTPWCSLNVQTCHLSRDAMAIEKPDFELYMSKEWQ